MDVDVAVPVPCKAAAVEDGKIMPIAADIDNCYEEGGCVACPKSKEAPGGKDRGFKLPLAVGEGGFILTVEFLLVWLEGTAATVEFSSGQHLGLDGNGRRIFVEGASWGGPRL